MKVGERRRPSRRLLWWLYGMGIATMLAVAGTMIVTRVFRDRSRRPILARTMMAVSGNNDLLADAIQGIKASSAAVDDVLDRFERDAEVALTVYALDGRQVTSNIAPPLPPLTASERHRLVTEGPAALGRVGPGLLVVAVRRGGALLGYAMVRPRPPPHRRELAVDVPIALVWIGLAALLLSRHLGRPLERIAAAARSFGNGDLAVRTGVDRRDEIGEVARSFDEMSERIGKLLEAQRELLASVSHELRTPLARIRVALDLAEEGDDTTARGSLRDVTADLTEIETLIDDIFSTARLELAALNGPRGVVPLRRAEIPVAELVARAVARLRSRAPDRTFHLDVDPAAEGGLVEADPVWLRRAIENVLENAHKYSGPGAEVNIFLRPTSEGFNIVVADRGYGIAPADVPRVFDPFFRADRSRARAKGGVGLGLALAKRVVEAHGGRIQLSSQLDLGTTVTFTLPALGAPAVAVDLRQRHIS
jgi:two-component system OmpR family sensor kinase